MAGSIIGALRATLGLDTAAFEKGADKGIAKSRQLKGALGDLAGGFGPVALGAAAGAAAVAAFSVGMQKAAEAAQFADDLVATADKIGVTAEALQELRHAAEVADIPAAKLDEGLQRLNATLGALQSGVGDGKVKAAFAELGIPHAQIQSLQSAEELLPLIAEHIQQVGTHAEQVQIAKKLGIEELLPLLLKGSDGIAQLREEAQLLGLVMSEEVAVSLADANEKLRIADERSRMAGRSLGAVLVPALVKVKNALADATQGLANFLTKLRDSPLASAPGWNPIRGMAAMLGRGDLPSDFGMDVDDADSIRNEQRAKDLAGAASPTRRARSSRSGGGSSNGGGSYGISTVPGTEGRDWGPAAAETLKPAFISASMEGALEGLKRSREEVAREWQFAVEGGLRAAVYGGGKGFMRYLADVFKESLVKQLAGALTGGGGGGGLLGGLASFGKSLLGFAGGGSFKVGGSGGIDSQIMAFRATPGEMIDVRTPGQTSGAGGGVLVVRVDKSDLFDVHVERVAAPMVAQGMAVASERGAGLAEKRLKSRGRQRLG